MTRKISITGNKLIDEFLDVMVTEFSQKIVNDLDEIIDEQQKKEEDDKKREELRLNSIDAEYRVVSNGKIKELSSENKNK